MKRKVVPFVFAAAMVAAVVLGGCGDSLTEVKAVEPTCTEAGHIAYYTDGEKYYSDAEGKNEISPESVVLSALEHNYTPSYSWNETEATVTLTCVRDSSHTRTEAMTVTSETTDATCVDGKIVYTAALTIDGKEYKDVKEVTLTATEEHSLPEDYLTSATEHWQVCEVCKNEIGKTVHDFEWITDKEATSVAGIRHEECKVCHYKRNEGTVIPATGSGLSFVEAKGPTCNTAGNIAYYTDGANYYSDASGVNEIKLEDTVIPATDNHNLTADYTTSAEEHWKVCVTCKNEIGKDEHGFEWITDKEASATENGLKHEECTVCHYKRSENTPIPATGGQIVISPVPAKTPTCTEKGNIAYYTDGEKYYSDAEGKNEISKESTEIAALDHDYGTPVTPEFTWDGYASATAKITCTRENCGHIEQASATITSEVTTPATCGESGVKTYTATATLNGAEYTDTKEETLPATGQHVIISKCGLDENNQVTYYKACKYCSHIQETLPHDHYADRQVTVNDETFTPYNCYNPAAETFVTYDVITERFIIHLNGSNFADGLTIAANNNEVIVSVDEDTTISSITFTNGWRQLNIQGDGNLTVTGKFASEAQSTTIDCNVTFNGGVETFTQLLVIRSGNVVVNGSLKSTACNITVGTADNSTQPTFTVNSTSGDGGIADGDWGRALNLQILSGTVNIVQTAGSAANVGISCNTASSAITLGENATLNIQGFAIGIAAWNSAVNNATLNVSGTLNITGTTEGNIRDMTGNYQQ